MTTVNIRSYIQAGQNVDTRQVVATKDFRKFTVNKSLTDNNILCKTLFE
jgi:hypothetical protein